MNYCETIAPLRVKFDYIMLGYNADMLPEIDLGDQVRMRKAHPCGGYDWKVVRLGADIGLVCLTCSHRILLTRRELARRMKNRIPKPQDEQQNS